MAIVGIVYLPTVSNPQPTSQTPASAIAAHLSDLFPTQTHSTFHLEHRLFVSTSSLLPHVDSRRTFTHFFASSHSSDKVFVSTSKTTGVATTNGSTSADGLSTIVIPTSSLEPFTALLSQKLQPQWAARQFVVLDNGTSVVLPLTDDAKWTIQAGDLRLSQSRVSGSAAGQSRGLVLEIQYETIDSDPKLEDEADKKKYDTLFRSLLRGLFRKLKMDLKLDDVKIHLVQTPTINHEGTEQKQQQPQQTGKPPGHELAELYMTVLQGSRG